MSPLRGFRGAQHDARGLAAVPSDAAATRLSGRRRENDCLRAGPVLRLPDSNVLRATPHSVSHNGVRAMVWLICAAQPSAADV